jgi:hypothetical protein
MSEPAESRPAALELEGVVHGYSQGGSPGFWSAPTAARWWWTGPLAASSRTTGAPA